jgi:hypothetical protein
VGYFFAIYFFLYSTPDATIDTPASHAPHGPQAARRVRRVYLNIVNET